MSEPATSIRLQGGLGNQLFQYAFGRELEHSRGVPISFNSLWLNRFATPREEVLSKLGLIDQTTLNRRAGGIGEFFATIASKSIDSSLPLFVDRLRRTLAKNCYFEEGENEYSDIPDNIAGRECIGYWQSESWFPSVAAAIHTELRTALRRYVPLEPDMVNIARKSVAIHVRRGDYLKTPQSKRLYDVIDHSYYQRTVEKLLARFGQDTEFLLYSDEPEMARALLPGIQNIRAAPLHERGDLGDFHCMSLAKSLVIANSSFSWWAGWLAERDHALVAAPATWNSRESKSPAPDRWLWWI